MRAGDRIPDGLDDEVVRARGCARAEVGQALRRPERAAARLRPLRRGGVDAGDDGHDPQRRARRRVGRGPGEDDGQPPLRVRLVPPADPDVRRDGRRDRRPPVRGRPFAAEARARGRPGRRPDRRRPRRAGRPLQADLRGGAPAARSPRTRASSSARAVEAVFQSWETPRAQVYRRAHEIPDDLGTAVNVVQMVFGNRGRALGDRRRVHTRPVHGRAGRVRRVPDQRAGRGRRRGHPHAGAARADGGRPPGGARPVHRDDQAARGALPRHAGHGVHGRGGDALPAPDPHREADRGRRAEGRGGHGRRGADLPRGGGRAHRPGPARPAAPPDDRPERVARRRRQGAERVAGRGGAGRSSSTPTWPRTRAAPARV